MGTDGCYQLFELRYGHVEPGSLATRKFCVSGPRCRSGKDIVIWKEVEEGWIRFDSYSGATHLLSPLARFVFELFERNSGALCSLAIATEVLAIEPDANIADCLVEVELTLQVLSEAKLIEISCLDRQRPDTE